MSTSFRATPADWSAGASDWDAVHLTFGGLLSAEQVGIESPSGWTYHWGWDCEQTLWLHWQFNGVERIGDHMTMEPLRGLVHPGSWYRTGNC